MTQGAQAWPEDADGDVFRRLSGRGFDFSKPYSVDYNVDFVHWPPSDRAVQVLETMYGPITLYDPNDNGNGYIQFQVFGPVTYESVTFIQGAVSEAMEPFGGICESWGVLQDAP